MAACDPGMPVTPVMVGGRIRGAPRSSALAPSDVASVKKDAKLGLSKITELKTFSRARVLAFRDKPVTAGHVGKELGASFVLSGVSYVAEVATGMSGAVGPSRRHSASATPDR